MCLNFPGGYPYQSIMDQKRHMLRHFLAALAYRTQKALRDAPEGFADFHVKEFVRTPHEIVLHMTGVILYASSLYKKVETWPRKCATFKDEIARFHEALEGLGRHFDAGTEIETSPERLLQGPLADAMTHVGQLAMLRRLYGSPVPGEGFMLADIRGENLSSDQPPPVRPDKSPVKPGQEGEIND